MKRQSIAKARDVYASGGNVTEYLRAEYGTDLNTSEIIEIAYDLQAGSYIRGLTENISSAQAYAKEIIPLLASHLSCDKSLLDAGTGELTTLSLLFASEQLQAKDIYAFDISWSRLHKGMSFWRDHVKREDISLHPFVADMNEIPLATNSIDVITTNHALEPNGGSLDTLLKELFRVCKDKLILFEPSYELNCEEGRARMDRLGYIKNMEATVIDLGGRVLDIIPVNSAVNTLNPTACFVIEPTESTDMRVSGSATQAIFTVPGTDFKLEEQDGFMTAVDVGLAYPIMQGIPVLKSKTGILATALE